MLTQTLVHGSLMLTIKPGPTQPLMFERELALHTYTTAPGLISSFGAGLERARAAD